MRPSALASVFSMAALCGLIGCATSSPLWDAVKAGDTEQALPLLATGRNVNECYYAAPEGSKNPVGAPLLGWAAHYGRVKTMEALLARGADPDKECKCSMYSPEVFATPLFMAVYSNQVEAARLLIDRGVNVNERSHHMLGNNHLCCDDSSPLAIAVSMGNSKVVKLLLERGADPNATYRDTRIINGFDGPVDQAADKLGHGEIARLIREAKSRPQTPSAAQRPVPSPESARPVEVSPESTVDGPSYKNAARPHDFALVIGISKYRDIPEAQFAEADARAVKKHLLALGYPERNIITLIGDRATKSTLTDKLEMWLPMNVKDDSTVFVYYSGHGAPDTESRQAYLVPWDGDPESLKSTAYPVARLYEKLEALKAKRVIVALDSCFSGAGGRSVLAKGARPLVTKIDAGELSSGRVVALTASSLDQISGSFEEEGHGAFTYFLLKGLNGDAADKDGHVTLGSLFDYLSPQVQDEAHRHEREQTPQLLPASSAATGLILR